MSYVNKSFESSNVLSLRCTDGWTDVSSNKNKNKTNLTNNRHAIDNIVFFVVVVVSKHSSSMTLS